MKKIIVKKIVCNDCGHTFEENVQVNEVYDEKRLEFLRTEYSPETCPGCKKRIASIGVFDNVGYVRCYD